MDWFEIVVKNHHRYLNMVRCFPENENNPDIEDIVHDAYLELHDLSNKKYKKGDKRVNKKYKDLPVSKRVLDENNENEVNMVYLWITLKRVSMKHLRRKEKDNYITHEAKEEVFQKKIHPNPVNEVAFDIILSKMDAEMKSWHWYDRLLFETYIKHNKSMRSLSKSTNISLTSIFTTLKNCKKRIKENLGEDFLDYINQDYELIK